MKPTSAVTDRAKRAPEPTCLARVHAASGLVATWLQRSVRGRNPRSVSGCFPRHTTSARDTRSRVFPSCASACHFCACVRARVLVLGGAGVGGQRWRAGKRALGLQSTFSGVAARHECKTLTISSSGDGEAIDPTVKSRRCGTDAAAISAEALASWDTLNFGQSKGASGYGSAAIETLSLPCDHAAGDLAM